MTNASLSLKVLCLLATLTASCLSKQVEVNETVSLLEGDVIVLRYRFFSTYPEFSRMVFALQGPDGPPHFYRNQFKIIADQTRIYIGMSDLYGPDVTRMLRVYEGYSGPGNWCEYHVRVFHDRYEVYIPNQPVVISKYPSKWMSEYNYASITRLEAVFNDYYSELGFVKRGPAIASHYFWFPTHRVSNEMSVQVEVGQTLFLELFIGNRTYFLWNKDEQVDGKAVLRLYNHNNMTLLQLDLDIHKGLQVTEPYVTDCGQFALDVNTILKIFVDVDDDKFVIHTDNNRVWNATRTTCAVIHRLDPNDLEGFVIKGDVEPFRYYLLERNETEQVTGLFAVLDDNNDTASN